MIRVMVDDLAFVRADAVVRPSSTTLEPISSALRNIEKVAGPAFHNQLAVKEELGVGAAVVTGAGELAADFVIHAVIQGRGEPVTGAGVRQALVSALRQISSWQLERVAIPPIGVGPGNLALEEAARIMLDVIVDHEREATYPTEVCIVVDTDEDKDMFDALQREME